MSELSLRPTLETDLRMAYQRNVDAGLVTPDTAQGLGAAAAAAATAGRQRRRDQGDYVEGADGLTPEEWMVEELGQAAAKFNKYNDVFPTGEFAAPDIDEIINQKEFEFTAARLHYAKTTLEASGLENPDGGKIGDSMKIVLIPWQGFRTFVDNLEPMLTRLRPEQGMLRTVDRIEPRLLQAIRRNDVPFYRSIASDGKTMSAREYLDHRIAHDGEWGMALMQTSATPGVKDLVAKSPDDLTAEGTRPFHIGNAEHLGSMGIFEWLALTLQEDPLAFTHTSWMLANRLKVNGAWRIPSGTWHRNNNSLCLDLLYVPTDRSEHILPRLTVL